MADRVPSVMLGLAFGLAVSVVNHMILFYGLNKGATIPSHITIKIILKRYVLRYLIDAVALFVMHRNTPLLIGTGFGLLGSKYYQTIRILHKDYIKGHNSKGMN